MNDTDLNAMPALPDTPPATTPAEPQAQASQALRFEDVVSGQFDADEASDALPPLKRVLLPQVETPKLHKVLAQAGLAERPGGAHGQDARCA